MSGEKPNIDYKIDFDTSSDKAKVDLVKNIVAMSNYGGGSIIFGRDEVSSPGISEEKTKALDSARITDFLERFITPAQISLGHNVELLPNGKYILEVIIVPTDFPVVFARDGMWKGADNKKDKPLFVKGDIWTRHSTKTERMTYEDLRTWIEKAKQKEKEQILDRINTIANLPDGANIQIVTSSGMPIDSPEKLLENAVSRRKRDPNHLLGLSDLYWVFQNRRTIHFNEDSISLLIATSLRRSSTLFYWILISDNKVEIIKDEIRKTILANDRDKSDAARSIIELAAIYMTNEEFLDILNKLSNSQYSHFRKITQKFKTKKEVLESIKTRIETSTYLGRKIRDYPLLLLEQFANDLLQEIALRSNVAKSKKLSDLNRGIWALSSKHFRIFG